MGGRGGGAATRRAETSAAETLRQQQLKAEAQRLTSCRETPAQLRLGAKPRVPPNVGANDCDGQRNNKGHARQPHSASRPVPRPRTVISGVSGLRRQAEEGGDVPRGVAEERGFPVEAFLLPRPRANIRGGNKPRRVGERARRRGGASGPSDLLAYEKNTHTKGKPAVILDLTLKGLSTAGRETLTRQVLFHLPLEDRIQTKCVEDTDVELGKLRRTNKKKVTLR